MAAFRSHPIPTIPFNQLYEFSNFHSSTIMGICQTVNLLLLLLTSSLHPPSLWHGRLTNQHHRAREQQWQNHEQLAARAPVHVVVRPMPSPKPSMSAAVRAPVHVVVRPHSGFVMPFRQRLAQAACSLAVRQHRRARAATRRLLSRILSPSSPRARFGEAGERGQALPCGFCLQWACHSPGFCCCARV
jgi:hypothetical protein